MKDIATVINNKNATGMAPLNAIGFMTSQISNKKKKHTN